MFLRSLCFASLALLGGCTYVNEAPAPTAGSGPAPATAAAPGRPPGCWSNADCGVTGGLCLPKPVTPELVDAEDFLARAMSLDKLVTRLGDSSSSSPLKTILQRVQQDLHTYSEIAQSRVPAPDANSRIEDPSQEGSIIRDEMDAAWMQSGATQAEWEIRQFSRRLSTAPLTTDAQKLSVDLLGDDAGLPLDKVIGDLQTLLQDLEVACAPVQREVSYRKPDGGVPGPKSGVGALRGYLGPLLKELEDATSAVQSRMVPDAIAPLQKELALVSRGHAVLGKDGTPGVCLGSPRD